MRKILLKSAAIACLAAGGASGVAAEELNVHPVCARAARLESAGKLEAIFLSGKTGHQIETANGVAREFDRTTIHVDINNDGRADAVIIDRYDSDAVYRLIDSSGTTITLHSKRDDDSSPDDLGSEFVVHRVGILNDHGINFIVTWRQGVFEQSYTMDEVVRIDGDDLIHEMCAFRALPAREHRARKGAPEVCRAVVKGRVNYSAFDVPVSAQLVDEFSQQPIILEPNAARVDVDNDGTPELIAEATFESGMTDTCVYRSLEWLNDAGTDSIASTRRDELRVQTRECADVRLRPFRFDGKTYIDRSPEDGSPWETRHVDRIERQSITTVCTIDVLKHYKLLEPYELFMNEFGNSIDREYIFGAALEKGPGLRWVKLIYERNAEFRSSLREPAAVAVLMSQAAEQHRVDGVEWLLHHGVNVRRDGADFLSKALRDSDFPRLPVLLIEHGADPTGLVSEIVSFSEERPVEGAAAMVAASRRLRYIPEEFVDHGVEADPAVLGKLAELGLPVRYERETPTAPAGGFMDRFGKSADGSAVTGEVLRQLRRLARKSPPIPAHATRGEAQ